jgi:large subunit ribosomal protein L44e
MKFPKTVKRYCRSCKKHTEMKLVHAKSGRKRGAMKEGQRRHKRRSGVKGYGSFPQPKIEKGSKYGAKQTKKTDFRYHCPACKKMFTSAGGGKRLKKVEVGQ